MKANNILEAIGNTPHIRVNRLFGATHQIWIKSERANPGGSIKDRIALSMIESRKKRKAQGGRRNHRADLGQYRYRPGDGRRGQGLSAAPGGPESMSIERRRLLLAYGASFELTPREKGMPGAIARAQELLASTPNN